MVILVLIDQYFVQDVVINTCQKWNAENKCVWDVNIHITNGVVIVVITVRRNDEDIGENCDW